MIDKQQLHALDSRIQQFFGLIYFGAKKRDVAAEAERILDAQVNTLVRPNWRATWEQDGWLASGWFDGPGLSDRQTADALYDLMTEMARFVMEAHLRSEYKAGLRKACRVYLKIRRVPLPKQPPAPTRRYCLIPPNKIRWLGEVPVEPRLWHLLGCVLDAGKRPLAFDVVQQKVFVGAAKEKTIQNATSQLNNHLLDIRFPWTLSARQGYISRS